MALVPRHGLQCASSAKLVPADRKTFAIEMTKCLALVAPVGMDEAARGEWIAAAWETLKHLPTDLLQTGCSVARQHCDHPAKIVPAILNATSAALRRRREHAGDQPRIEGPKPDYVTADQAADILREYGLKPSGSS